MSMDRSDTVQDDLMATWAEMPRSPGHAFYLASLGMTPDQYRQKWNLPGDYPMVAPEYAAARSALAKQIGLGRPAKDAAKAKSGANLQPVEEGTPPQQGSANDPN